jgi:hypothetical protein
MTFFGFSPGEPMTRPPPTYFFFRAQAQPQPYHQQTSNMDAQAAITDLAYPAPKSHPLVIVGAINSSCADRTFAKRDLQAGAIFAYVRGTGDGLRVCPTDNLGSETEEVFLGHDGKPNLVCLSLHLPSI